MHIPDGYLSPSTCAVLYAGVAPFWYVALRRVKRELETRTIPLLALFSAFSFVIMMFNLPLPGGTTGHAVGMGMASIVLGPWVSILAISVALLIQAIFFGDGGITAFGANCFNMAVVASLVAFGFYRLLSYGADLTSRRRVFAAGFAGYAAINAAALCAAVEFGIQPMFFRDASGAPLYAPYPLSVSVPAMMIGHLTFAGLAELVLSAGIVVYLQRADPILLRRTAPHVACTILAGPELTVERRKLPFKSLWIGLGILLVLTPLGIVAVGSAWGEWHAKDFSDPTARQQIAAASANKGAPTSAPKGLERLSSIWKAPMSEYAPAFAGSPSLKYLVSAFAGVSLIILCWLLITRLLIGFRSHRSRQRRSFLESTMRGLLNSMDEVVFAENLAESRGFLQGLDARVKLVGIGSLILSVVAVHRLWVLLALFVVAMLLAGLSHISIGLLAKRIWLPVLAFTGVIALPAILLVPGRALFQIPLFGWTATVQGLTSAIFLTLRAETAATLALLLVLSTRWNQLLRGLRFLHAPVVFVVIVETTYRFVFVLLQTTKNMFEARRVRLIGHLDGAEQRRFAAATVGVLLDKSLQFSTDVHAAMRARGFRGEAILLDDLHMRSEDWFKLGALMGLGVLAIWLGL